MKFKSFKKKSKRSSASQADESAGLSASDVASTPLDSPTSGGGGGESVQGVITPPASPLEAPSSPPSSPGRTSSVASGSGGASSALRPLRLGSFNFDNPDTNASIHGETNDQTRTLTFPPLFHEADDMLILSNLIYTLAELRDLARNGVLNNPTQSLRILELPLPLDTALKIIVQEGELLREVLDDGKHEATLSALESMLGRQRETMAAKEEEKAAAAEAVDEGGKQKKAGDDGGMFGWMANWDGCLAGGFSFDEMFCGDLGQVAPDKKDADNSAANGAAERQVVESSMLTAMGDLKSAEELVYAVGVNPAEERITVVFRGSVTKADFMTDAQISMARVPGPSEFNGTTGDGDIGGEVGVHSGFYQYLFGEANGQPNKYSEIMKHVKTLLNETPSRRNYKLYITGHSLGGALATLFGFYAAASATLPLPVTIVSVASPRVGNVAFARTFAELESQGKLRHLRVANHKDPVTLGPTVSSKRALALSAKAFSPLGYLALKVLGNGEGGEEEVYYHTGIKMKMFKSVSSVGSQRCELSYSGATIVSGSKRPVAIDKDDLAEIEQSNRKKKGSASELPMVSYHYGTAYSERMGLVESDLQGLTLNGVYREKACGMPWVT